MAQIIRKTQPKKFEPYQIVIDVDTIEVAMVYKGLFGASGTVADVLYNREPEIFDEAHISKDDIANIIENEFSYEDWQNLA